MLSSIGFALVGLLIGILAGRSRQLSKESGLGILYLLIALALITALVGGVAGIIILPSDTGVWVLRIALAALSFSLGAFFSV